MLSDIGLPFGAYCCRKNIELSIITMITFYFEKLYYFFYES